MNPHRISREDNHFTSGQNPVEVCWTAATLHQHATSGFPVRASSASRNESWSVSFAFFSESLVMAQCLAAAEARHFLLSSSKRDVCPEDPRTVVVVDR
jgi:hypothetical protein